MQTFNFTLHNVTVLNIGEIGIKRHTRIKRLFQINRGSEHRHLDF